MILKQCDFAQPVIFYGALIIAHQTFFERDGEQFVAELYDVFFFRFPP